jgi:hypothetical protein
MKTRHWTQVQAPPNLTAHLPQIHLLIDLPSGRIPRDFQIKIRCGFASFPSSADKPFTVSFYIG